MNTIYILWLRQLKKYSRSIPRIIGSLGQPILFLLVFGFGFGSIFSKAGGGNYIQFLVPGIVAMAVVFTAIFGGIELIWDRQFGFLKETMVAPVSRFNIMLGRTFGGATVSVIQGIAVLIISFFVGFKLSNPLMIFPALLFMFLTAFFFTALGTAIASQLTDMQAFPIIMNFLVMPLFFLSGSIFPLTTAPKALQIIGKLDPLSYGIDGLRYVFEGISIYNPWIDLFVLIGFSVVVVLIGRYLFEKMEA
ncbi:MAG: ABC transporter permease [Candidatus Pacebacteria bacterium]|nr:ABC transporter permease [Candidatus Paceibacterota bacterium]